MGGWIGVDLDGTLAMYNGWKGVDHIGEPIKPMVERVKKWLAQGREVRIFTARVNDCGAVYKSLPTGDVFDKDSLDTDRVRKNIEEWCLKHIGVVLPITNVKDYGMIELWDDRAVQVVFNEGIPVTNNKD